MYRQSKWKFYGEDKVWFKTGKSRSQSMAGYHWTYLYKSEEERGKYQIIKMIHILWEKSPPKNNNFWMSTNKVRAYGRKPLEIKY